MKRRELIKPVNRSAGELMKIIKESITSGESKIGDLTFMDAHSVRLILESLGYSARVETDTDENGESFGSSDDWKAVFYEMDKERDSK